MYLGNPLLPSKTTIDEATSMVKKVLLEKNWVEIKKPKVRILLESYFFFNYHYFNESSSKENIIENSVDGLLAINAFTLLIDKEISDLIIKNSKDVSNVAPSIDFIKIKSIIDKKNAGEVIKLKVAEHFKVSKKNVVVSGIKKYMVSFYELTFNINKKDIVVLVNSVNGKIIDSTRIPVREKELMEVTKETLQELAHPNSWLKYTKEIFLEIGTKLSKKLKKGKQKNNVILIKDLKEKNFTKSLAFLDSKLVWIIIILLAIFLIYLSFL
ncbi:MAG: hypothetical protein PHX27_01375 [Candidatus ainarchaeum sp.]|nr:hypothetical protein [Candidatus ainarchaeum sp.]